MVNGSPSLSLLLGWQRTPVGTMQAEGTQSLPPLPLSLVYLSLHTVQGDRAGVFLDFTLPPPPHPGQPGASTIWEDEKWEGRCGVLLSTERKKGVYIFT